MKAIGLFVILVFFTAFIPVHAQLTETNVNDSLINDKDLLFDNEIQGFTSAPAQEKTENPIRLHSFVGTDFSYSKLFGFGQGINFGINGSYSLSKRFILSAGSYIDFSRFSKFPTGLTSESSNIPSGFNAAYISVYVRGDYFVTPRLTLTGIAFKEFSPYHNQTINPMFLNYNREGMSVGVNYQLFENVHVGAQFNYFRNDNPYLPFRGNKSVIDNYYW